jgi:hypothetical protein
MQFERGKPPETPNAPYRAARMFLKFSGQPAGMQGSGCCGGVRWRQLVPCFLRTRAFPPGRKQGFGTSPIQRFYAFSVQSELSTPNSAPHASNGKQSASTGTREVLFAPSDLSTVDLSSPCMMTQYCTIQYCTAGILYSIKYCTLGILYSTDVCDPEWYDQVFRSGHTVECAHRAGIPS